MPTYEYRCPKGHDFELFQKMSDPPEASCPECGAAAERKLSGGAGLLFKGSGFYITDYRSEAYRKAAASESGSDGGGGKGSESGSGAGSASKEGSGSRKEGAASGKAGGQPGKDGGSASGSKGASKGKNGESSGA